MGLRSPRGEDLGLDWGSLCCIGKVGKLRRSLSWKYKLKPKCPQAPPHLLLPLHICTHTSSGLRHRAHISGLFSSPVLKMEIALCLVAASGGGSLFTWQTSVELPFSAGTVGVILNKSNAAQSLPSVYSFLGSPVRK